MKTRCVSYALLTVALCAARLQTDRQTEEIDTATSFLFDLLCLQNGTVCDAASTCSSCCSKQSYIAEGTLQSTCGAEPSTTCLVNGTSCSNETHYECNNCCNGNFLDNGATCGGECLAAGTTCSKKNYFAENSTCHLCCDGTIIKDKSIVCGCLDDGTPCEGDECYSCCNGAFDDDGKKCGGQCLESGTECTYDSTNPTCYLCCNNTAWGDRDDKYQCGCIEDGEACVPGDTCYHCCNGSYNDGGYTCGGQCIEDGMECSYGEECNLCCNSSSYWYSTGKLQCGTEPCYKDGESCIPGKNCDKCCSGGAYDGDGTTCGGTCIPNGTKCTYHSNCTKCCPSDDNYYTYTGSSYMYHLSDTPYHWDKVQESLICGSEMCKEDGTACTRGVDCHNCCNSYHDWNSTCGGTCIPSGTRCNSYFDSTCYQCCETYYYNDTVGYNLCSNYTEYPSLGTDYPSLSAVPSTVTTSTPYPTMM